MSSYLDEHPGGDDVVLAATGTPFSDFNWIRRSFSPEFCLLPDEIIIKANQAIHNILHPVLLYSFQGKDATDEFEDAGHSKEARELLETFCIGELDKSSPPAIPELEIVSKKLSSDYARKLVDLTKQYWAVPVAVIGISVVAGFFVLRKK